MRALSKKRQQEFFNKTIEAILKLDVTILPDEGMFTRYSMDTKGGELIISFPEALDHVYTYTIYTRFKDVKKAKKLNLRLMNKFSGKYNLHLSVTRHTVDEAVDCIIDHLKETL